VLIMVFPVVLVIVALAPEILSVWVGGQFAAQSTIVLQVLGVGVLVNSFAQAPFALLQATRRPDLTAKLHLAELPVYTVMILAFGARMGVAGVALAWTARVAIDTAALGWMSRRELPELAPDLQRSFGWLAVMIATAAIVALPTGLLARVILTTIALALFAVFGWNRLLSSTERVVVREYLPWPRRPVSAS
jgi:O-antigen/teichoic acid export membrane protein